MKNVLRSAPQIEGLEKAERQLSRDHSAGWPIPATLKELMRIRTTG